MDRRRLLAVMFMVCLCALSTGCLRMVAQGMANIASAMGPRASPNIMFTNHFFDGTKHVAPLILSPIAPIAIIDLPFEIVWDVLLLPLQFYGRAEGWRNRKKTIEAMSIERLVSYGHIDEFRKRVAKADTKALLDILEGFRRPYSEYPDTYMPYIDIILKGKRHKECGDYVLNSLNCREDTELTLHLFSLGLRPTDYKHEHAVFNAVKHIERLLLQASYPISIVYISKRIQILLENGCNPNSIPEYDCKYIGDIEDNYDGKTALDIARNSLEYSRKWNYHKNSVPYLEQIIALLEKHGAKTADELKHSGDLKWLILSDLFYDRNLKQFNTRLKYASRTEKNEAMEKVFFSEVPIEEFAPYCRLLIDEGVPFPAKFIYSSTPTPKMLQLYEFAFANGFKGADYPNCHAVTRLCWKIFSDYPECKLVLHEYDSRYIELLRLLLKNGCNPNSTVFGYTALSVLQTDLNHKHIVGGKVTQEALESHLRMVREMIDLVKQYGGITTEELKRLQKNDGGR